MILGIKNSQFDFVPFPIDQPERLMDFVDVSVVCFTTLYDEWNRYKVQVLEKQGYTVEVLWERERKDFEGKVIRDSIRAGTNDWESMVPIATQKAVKDFRLQQRLIELYSL